MELNADARTELKAVISVGYDRSVSSRARMVLDHADGVGVAEIAEATGATRPTVYKWIARYEEGGIAGLDDHKSPGRPRTVTDEQRARIIALTKLPPPESTGLTHWSSHEMAKYLKRNEGIEVSHNSFPSCGAKTTSSLTSKELSKSRRIQIFPRRSLTS